MRTFFTLSRAFSSNFKHTHTHTHWCGYRILRARVEIFVNLDSRRIQKDIGSGPRRRNPRQRETFGEIGIRLMRK